jgi:glycosyltransferase involved in cell wall biosynthesis
MMKKKVLIFSSYFLPGYMAGGPIRSLANLIQHFESEYDFYVITRDRDLGSDTPFVESLTGDWVKIGGAQVRYFSKSSYSATTIIKLVREVNPDLLYFNSFFDPLFTIKPLILRRLGLIPKSIAVIISPRGEFADGALAIKTAKKKVFLKVAKFFSLYKNLVWQASSEFESNDIKKNLGLDLNVVIAANLPPRINHRQITIKNKNPESLQVVCVARVARNKNIDGALSILKLVTANINFHIYGPIEDKLYMDECLDIVKTLPNNIVVNFHGPLPSEKIMSVISAYDLFFLPTEGENFGHAILEALQCGLPVLISDRTPWRNLESLGIGWDFPLEQPTLFKATLELCASMNEEDFSKLIHQAKAYGYKVSHNEETIASTRRLFEQALSG